MNRRSFVAGSMVAAPFAGSVGNPANATMSSRLASLNQSYSAVLESLQTRRARDSGILEDYDTAQTMYLGMLSTWWQLSTDSVLVLGKVMDGGPTPDRDQMAVDFALSVGVWVFIDTDARRFDAPILFSDAHEAFLDHSRHMALAAPLMVEGVHSGNAVKLDSASEHLSIAASLIPSVETALGFSIPDRDMIED